MSRILSVSAAVLASALLIGASSSFASASSTTVSASSADSTTAVVAPNSFGQAATSITGKTASAAMDAKVRAYWTPQRLASAVPYDSKTVAAQKIPAQATANGPAKTTPGVAPLVGSAKAQAGGVVKAGPSAAATPVTNFPNTNGKLFFGGYGAGNAYCTASAINTPTKRAIITAGHCVYDAGAWKSNVVFVPNYDNRNADPDPVGIWSVYTMRTFNSWINSSDLTHDVGIATLYNGGDTNARIVDRVGGHGLYYNGTYNFDVSIFGYPSNKTNPNGRYTMWACWGTTFQSGNRDSINGCFFGPGASGGPWLFQYSNASGLGYVRSVTSTWNQTSGQNWAPYFTNDMQTLVTASNSDW